MLILGKLHFLKLRYFFIIDKIKVDSWWRWLFWHCSYCFCKCDAPGPNSDRYWSLKSATSDIESNKIITGVKFVKKNRIIQIEIEQSETLPEGIINDTNRTWIENSYENLSIEDPDVYEMSYENRALDIDMLEAPPGIPTYLLHTGQGNLKKARQKTREIK